MSTLSDLKDAQGEIDSFVVVALGGTAGLLIGIDDALSPPPPSGSPDTVGAQAHAYRSAAQQSGQVAADIHAVATGTLPSGWKGDVAETAAQAVAALSTEVARTESTLSRAAQALDQWADTLRWAQAADRQGVALLQQAKGKLGFLGMDVLAIGEAQKLASQGVSNRVAAAQSAEDVGTRTARLLDQLADQARAERVTASSADALDAVVLAGTADPGGSADNGDILTDTQLARASQRLNGMPPADRARFDALVAGARSPQEAAYLWKALAAGHSVDEVARFDAAIHPHGGDPTWLAQHLTPEFGTPGARAETSAQSSLRYKGQGYYDGNGSGVYDQGSVGDCVAASTVVAQASLDPTLMLKLTTGGTANGDDSPDAFKARLHDLYVSEYIRGQHADGDSSTYPSTDTGLGTKGEDLLANTDLGSAGGSGYHHVDLNSTADRQAAVGPIEQAVDAGRPVPIQVTNGSEGHQMMIIGHDGDRLEVYNPWGFTSWVTEDQFVNNQLGGLTDTQNTHAGLSTADGLELPR